MEDAKSFICIQFHAKYSQLYDKQNNLTKLSNILQFFYCALIETFLPFLFLLVWMDTRVLLENSDHSLITSTCLTQAISINRCSALDPQGKYPPEVHSSTSEIVNKFSTIHHIPDESDVITAAGPDGISCALEMYPSFPCPSLLESSKNMKISFTNSQKVK